MKTITETTAMEISEEMLEEVNGGTFTPNKYSEGQYHKYGIRTEYHTFAKDEFWLPDGTKTDEEGANRYLESVGKETPQLENLINIGASMFSGIAHFRHRYTN